MAKDNQLENFVLEENKIYRGTFYKLGGRHYGGKIVCDNGEEYVLSVDPKVVSGSVVEFRRSNGEIIIERVVELKQKRVSGVIIKTPSGSIKFIEKDYRGLGKEYIITNDPNSELIRGAFGRTVNAVIVDDNTVTVDKVFGVVGNLRDDVEAIMDRIGMSQNWSDEALKELEQIPEEVDYSSINLTDEDGEIINTETYNPSKPNYIDLRDKMFCTIDPDDCQDILSLRSM